MVEGAGFPKLPDIQSLARIAWNQDDLGAEVGGTPAQLSRSVSRSTEGPSVGGLGGMALYDEGFS